MSYEIAVAAWAFSAFFAFTGALILAIDNSESTTKQWLVLLKKNDNVAFAWHLGCWMVAGMIANYYWTWINAGATNESFELKKILLPLLVAPIVFYPTWGLWTASNKDNRILFIMLAFQNGFFWQSFFQKAQQTVGH